MAQEWHLVNKLMDDFHTFVHSVSTLFVDYVLTMSQALLSAGNTCETDRASAFTEVSTVGDSSK